MAVKALKSFYDCKWNFFDSLFRGMYRFMCLPPSLSLFFSLSDIDPVSVTPAQPQVVMLGDKAEWQCKTKGSAPHTVQWKKVRSITSSTSPPSSKVEHCQEYFSSSVQVKSKPHLSYIFNTTVWMSNKNSVLSGPPCLVIL